MSPEPGTGGIAIGFDNSVVLAGGSGAVEDGALLLDKVSAFLSRFVAFPSPLYAAACALWVVHTHALDAFESTPRLAIISAEKQSGKTRLLEVLELLVVNSMHAVNISVAALFRQIGSSRPVLLADEADTYLGLRVAKEHEELRGLVNAGHRRGAVAYRCVGEPSKMQVQAFPAFCAVALAGIGDLPDTIIDRSIVLPARRRAPHEHVEQFRYRRVRPVGEGLRDRIAVWAEAHMQFLEDSEPEMPDGIVDRAADVWEPLLAIADAAGGEWPARARETARELNRKRAAADVSLGVLLLTDIRRIFSDLDGEKISTEDLIERLSKLEESPWGDLRGKPIDARGIARRLRPFDVRPKQIRLSDTETRKGYERSDFVDTWTRYLAPLGKGETSETAVTEQVQGPGSVSQEGSVSDASETRTGNETATGPTTRDVPSVSDVSQFSGSEGEATLVEQEARVAAWNGSLPSPDLDDIPNAKGPMTVLKGDRR